jgi:uncharacterized protein
MFFDPWYFVYLAPAILLALWAQAKVRSTYAAAMQVPTRVTGAQAARMVLDQAGLHDVTIEQVPGQLSDHYDPSAKVLRLSPEVYNRASAASVGIAAHEAGHAMQDAFAYAPLTIRNLAVPAANFGGGLGGTVLVLGFIMSMPMLIWVGIGLFSAVVVFQLVNLPVEFNASSRAKDQLVSLGIVADQDMSYVRSVLNAAAWTYVAGTLQSVLTLVYYLTLVMGGSRDE